MNELVRRLRQWTADPPVTDWQRTAKDAIDRIEALEQRVREARRAMQKIVACEPIEYSSSDEHYIEVFDRARSWLQAVEITKGD